MANLEILLSKKPQPGQQQLSEVFQLKYGPIPQEQQLQEGQVLVENLYLSIDAAMRIWINGAKTYVDGVKPGQTMVGRTVSKVLESKSPKFLKGDTVSGFLRWTQFEIVQGKELKLLKRGDLDEISCLHSIGPLDISGLTAYVGFETIGKPKENETIVVSAASGGVGEIAIQLAKYYYKCRVVGIAGGQEKCNYVKKALGADDCIDYTQKNLNQRLKESCPNGINIYFDNVGGEILDEVLMHIVDQTRVILCGAVSTYNTAEQYKIKNYPRLIIKRAVMQGFIYFDYPQLFKPGQEVISKMIREGQMKIRYDIQNGLDEAPGALQRLLTGKNNGKVIVRVQKQEKSKL